ncbi:hypothetical protein BD309DRAFT_960411 [Dichomitus squalens]|uniref:Uncharacterized protein n=2 Tax=Dichomitus squalens TaxID=114155 RepID=A0A4Q9NPV2_9APHY|nr:uncharacterized protein DICSQDRAFT_171954 [Dichomitus squalens LYAD-421 SS1]EJF59555.1 hypothetical protein DICSQDRAFT_171954 [Dichomitus squalens LYAD-421 SS1]TBU43550.1 hypothetical protein BD309DRAFT_960411 [Dichomitus squalens]TBU58588.1 hypothetical protein BD310DRAFT_878795 [Dichomitus squalens]
MALASDPKSVIRLLTYALVFMTAVNVVFLGIIVNVFDKLVPPPRVYSYIGDDFPSQLPVKLPSVGLALNNPAPHFSLLSDEEWGAQYPGETVGFTDLGPMNRTFFPSMLHQMHCLDVIRVGMATNRTGFARHVEHCTRYLRQIVLCNSDVTLEPAYREEKDGDWMWAADGINSIHRCKDWTVVRKYLEEHPAKSPVPPADGKINPDETYEHVVKLKGGM